MRRATSTSAACVLFLCAVLAFSTPAPAPAQDKNPPKFSARVDLVSLDVEVLDARGEPVPGLVRDDFQVKENGRVMAVSNFAMYTDRPVSLAVVLDVSGMPREELVVARQFVFRLAHVLSPGDEICLYTFDHHDVTLEQEFTRDRAPLLEALRNIDTATGRGTAVLKELFGATPVTALAIDIALAHLRRGTNAKRALLVISNRYKGLGPVTVEHIQEAGHTFMTLSFSNKANWLISLGGDQISKNALIKQSGGRQFSANTEDITGTCRAIAFSLKNHYSLAYPTEIGTGRQKRREVEVLTPGKKIQLNVRRSYVPPP